MKTRLVTGWNYLPIKSFPALPGEEMIESRRRLGKHRRLVSRRPKRGDRVAGILRQLGRTLSAKEERELNSTVRKEISLIASEYGEKVTMGYPIRLGRGTFLPLISVESPPITLTDNTGPVTIGTLNINIGLLIQRYHYHWGTLSIRVTGNRLDRIGVARTCHPHVHSYGNPCLGDGQGRIERALREGFLYDAVKMMLNHLGTYNPRSPVTLLDHFREQASCPSCDWRGGRERLRPCNECNLVVCPHCMERMEDRDVCYNCYRDLQAEQYGGRVLGWHNP
jgi:hypothetical protein